jgi:hypothetical protein
VRQVKAVKVVLEDQPTVNPEDSVEASSFTVGSASQLDGPAGDCNPINILKSMRMRRDGITPG